MIKKLSAFILAIVLCLLLCSCGDERCIHTDKNDDGECDVCGDDYSDGCDNHTDENDDGQCDVCGGDYSDDCDNHTDKNDDGKCDVCGGDYSDGCDNHTDKNDDGKCDVCGGDYSDGCDNHTDENDDGKCDVCGGDYSDGCDNHTDENDDGKCDTCNTEFTDGLENIMDGKKIIFIGNSYTYYGQTVLEKSQSWLKQSDRTGDMGYFYNLCKANGADTEVTNWTFGGHGLRSLFGGNCQANRGCDGVDHKAYLTDTYYDYVIIQPGGSEASLKTFVEDMDLIMDFFKASNPDVKFAILIPYSAYGTIGSSPYLAKELLNSLGDMEKNGVTVINWGGLVMDILNGKITVPGSQLKYTNNTFIIRKSAKDGYHPNQLSGYITTLMTYCALTGESAVNQPYDFCNDRALRPDGYGSKFFDFDGFISTYYIYNNETTNYPDVFASETDMRGIQALIDDYLAAKPHLNFNYPESDGDEDDSGTQAPGEDSDQDTSLYVAKVLNGGVESYLTLGELQSKIVDGYTNGDYITLLTDVICRGATSSNMKTKKTVTVTFDLSGKTLTLTSGSIMRTTYRDGFKSTFNLISSNGKGTLTLAEGNTYTAFQMYGENKNVTVGTEIGYTDGDVVVINATRLLYVSNYYANDGATSSIIFYGGEYNQIGNLSEGNGFIISSGKYNEGYDSQYFAGSVRFIGAKINQTVKSDYPLFATVFSTDGIIPKAAVKIPGIILNDCIINAYSADTPLHNMETLPSLITYTGCQIYGNVMKIGIDATDVGLGKVILGADTVFSAQDSEVLELVKSYDGDAIESFDGASSGIYLADGTALEKTEHGFKVINSPSE